MVHLQQYPYDRQDEAPTCIAMKKLIYSCFEHDINLLIVHTLLLIFRLYVRTIDLPGLTVVVDVGVVFDTCAALIIGRIKS